MRSTRQQFYMSRRILGLLNKYMYVGLGLSQETEINEQMYLGLSQKMESPKAIKSS